MTLFCTPAYINERNAYKAGHKRPHGVIVFLALTFFGCFCKKEIEILLNRWFEVNIFINIFATR